MWQEATVGVLVAAAVGYVAVRLTRSLRSKGGAGCGCDTPGCQGKKSPKNNVNICTEICQNCDIGNCQERRHPPGGPTGK